MVVGELFLCVNYYLWATSGDTLLWLWIGAGVPVKLVHLREKFPSLLESEGGSGPYDVPIYLTPGVEYRRVMDDVVGQVKAIWEMAAATGSEPTGC